ncbi:hypothetical protein [Cellulomonas sp. SG140]|uniref:hypothetical protein n=1 Tax=Cellulomonas sp. SG140 TaxID=2976536 RepID=UPI0021E9334F|nr:hypothetical protein [Cellulomonas sp. SG140]
MKVQLSVGESPDCQNGVLACADASHLNDWTASVDGLASRVRTDGVTAVAGDHPFPGRLVSQESVTGPRVVEVGVKHGVGQVRLPELTGGHGCGEPAVVRLPGELEDRGGHPVGGELTHERVEPFPGRFAWDKYATARRSTSFTCPRRRMR